jgi:transcriptional regulator with XRE-family HTH domain
MNIGQIIRRLRRDKDITQRELGKAVGVAESTISLYESGRNIPDLNMMRKLAIFFNVSLDYLAGDAVAEEVADYNPGFSAIELELLTRFRALSDAAKQVVLNLISNLEALEKTKNEQSSGVS